MSYLILRNHLPDDIIGIVNSYKDEIEPWDALRFEWSVVIPIGTILPVIKYHGLRWQHYLIKSPHSLRRAINFSDDDD